MQVTCRDCQASFDVPTEHLRLSGTPSSCPHCKAAFRVLPTRTPGQLPEVVFEGKKVAQRTCINCSREFEADMLEPIPICPDCERSSREDPSRLQKPVWKMFRDGRPLELDSEAAVREWIRRGEIRAEDRLTSPEGIQAPARRFSQFREALESQRESAPVSGIGSPARFLRRIYRADVLGKVIVFVFVSFAVAWTLYRVVTFVPPPSRDPALQRFVAQLKERVAIPDRPSDLLLAEARSLLSMDLPEHTEGAVRLLEQSLVADPASTAALGLLAEAYGLFIPLQDDPGFSVRALEIADLVRRLHPRRAEGEIARARSALGAKNLPLADAASKAALELDPEHPRALLVRSRTLLSLASEGDSLEPVISLASLALSQDAALLEAYDLIGEVHARRGDPQRSTDAYERRFRQSPADPLAPFRLGGIQQRAKRFAAAQEWYEEALRANAHFTPARLGLALIRARIERKPDVAERHLRQILGRYRAFARQEELWTATRELIRILLHSKREAEARELARTLPVLIADTPDLRISQARALATASDDREALTSLESYLASHPSEAEAQLLLAQILERRGREEETVRAYRATLALRPQWVTPHLLFTRFLIRRNRDEDALDVANALVSRAGLQADTELALPLDGETDPPDWKELLPLFRLLAQRHPESAVASALLGLAHLNAGQLKPALRAFERSRTSTASLEYPNVYLAQTFLQLKKPEAALPALKNALAINPTSATSHYWLGVTLARMKRWVEAEKALSIALHDKTWGYRAMNALGEVFASRGERAAAESWWKRSLEVEPRAVPPWVSLLRPASD